MIPVSPAEVTPSWLSEVLAADVTEVDVSPVGTGQTGATYRVAVRYRTESALPPSFVVKLPAQDPAVRERVALSYRSEHAFYTRVAATVEVPLARCHHCAITDDGARFVLLLDDMAPAAQGDQIVGCTAGEAELAVVALAGLHGPRWCDPAWLNLEGTVMPRPDAATAQGLGDITKLAIATTVEKLGPRLTAADRDTLLESGDLIADWLLGAPERFSVLHGDYRIDNLLFDPQRTRVTVVDWQTLAVGLPARDLAYFLATSLPGEDRGRYEHELVESYRRALAVWEVEDYDTETCWDDYRFGMLQVPLITTLGFAFSASTERGEDMVLTMLERGGRAIRELGTLDLIRARV